MAHVLFLFNPAGISAINIGLLKLAEWLRWDYKKVNM